MFGDKYSKSQIKNSELLDKEIDKESWLIKFDEKINENKETIETEGDPKRKRGRPSKIQTTCKEQHLEELEEENIGLEKDKMNALLARLNEDPVLYREAMSTSERDHWEIAIREELKSMKENEVWKLVERPKIVDGKKPNIIYSKWVLKEKKETDNKIKNTKPGW